MGKKVVAPDHRYGAAARPQVGNAMEVEDCIGNHGTVAPKEFATSASNSLAGCSSSATAKIRRRRQASRCGNIASGRARETFREIIRLQGGDQESSTIRPVCRARAIGLQFTQKRAGYITPFMRHVASRACCSAAAARKKRTPWTQPSGSCSEKNRDA